MSLLINESYVNPAQPLWVSTNGGTIEGELTVKDEISIAPSVTSGSSTLALGPGVAPDYPYTSLIQSVPVDIATSVGSELAFYTRQNILATPPAIAMRIDSTQNVTMFGNLQVNNILTGNVSANAITLPVVGPGPTAGKAFIPAGSDNVVVPTTAVTADSIILVTRMGNQATGPGIGSGQQFIMVPSAQIVPATHFEAFLVDASGIVVAANTVNAEFSWVIIN